MTQSLYCFILRQNFITGVYQVSEEIMKKDDNGCADAKAAICIIAIVVVTAAFWLLGR